MARGLVGVLLGARVRWDELHLGVLEARGVGHPRRAPGARRRTPGPNISPSSRVRSQELLNAQSTRSARRSLAGRVILTAEAAPGWKGFFGTTATTGPPLKERLRGLSAAVPRPLLQPRLLRPKRRWPRRRYHHCRHLRHCRWHTSPRRPPSAPPDPVAPGAPGAPSAPRAPGVAAPSLTTVVELVLLLLVVLLELVVDEIDVDDGRVGGVVVVRAARGPGDPL